MRYCPRTCAGSLLAAALLLGLPVMSPPAQAQQVIVIVNGEPITALDVEQRSKFTQLSTQKTPTRQEVIDELISEKLKIREAKRFGLEISDSEVDSALSSMSSRMRLTAEQLTQQLARSGVNIATLKHRIRADLAWPQLVRGRYQSSLQIGEKDLLTVMESKPGDSVGFDYTLRPILFVIPPGSSEAFIDGRKREAEALRGRFEGCEEGIAFARALKDVAIREQIIRSAADIPPEQRKILDGIEVGHLTPPEVTKYGVEMFAVCAKKESSGDNTLSKRKARESLLAERYEQLSKRYLKELRKHAMLEYK